MCSASKIAAGDSMLYALTNSYHNIPYNPYPFPSDKREVDRLDKMQDVVHILFHRNVLIPLTDVPGTKVLDIGTGSGGPL